MKHKRGDIVWVRFPFTDLSSTKVRPALIISNFYSSSNNDYILLQITSKEKSGSLNLELKNSDYVEAPLGIKSFVVPNKVFTLNESLIVSRETALTEEATGKAASILMACVTIRTPFWSFPR